MKNKLSYFTIRSIRKVVEQKGFRFDHISFTVIDGVALYSIKFYYNKHIKHEIIYTKVFFVKGKKQLDICLVTKTRPRTQKLKEQLIEYFGGEV